MSSTKPNLPALKTPVSSTYPSEIASPITCTPTYIKQEDLKTPITPPAAYLDFLKAVSPTLMTPTTGDKPSFPDDKLLTKTSSTAQPPPTTRTLSSTSTASASSTNTTSTASGKSNCSCSCKNHNSPHITVPPSPFALPLSARSPRRLRIPQSPYSPAARSPLSAASMTSIHGNVAKRMGRRKGRDILIDTGCERSIGGDEDGYIFAHCTGSCTDCKRRKIEE